jgi:hypothetical protein
VLVAVWIDLEGSQRVLNCLHRVREVDIDCLLHEDGCGVDSLWVTVCPLETPVPAGQAEVDGFGGEIVGGSLLLNVLIQLLLFLFLVSGHSRATLGLHVVLLREEQRTDGAR